MDVHKFSTFPLLACSQLLDHDLHSTFILWKCCIGSLSWAGLPGERWDLSWLNKYNIIRNNDTLWLLVLLPDFPQSSYFVHGLWGAGGVVDSLLQLSCERDAVGSCYGTPATFLGNLRDPRFIRLALKLAAIVGASPTSCNATQLNSCFQDKLCL